MILVDASVWLSACAWCGLVRLDGRWVTETEAIRELRGSAGESPPSFTLQPRIIVRPDMRGHKIVTIRAPQVNFATQKIKAMTVETRYVDGEAGLSFNNVANFASANDQASFEFDYVDPAKSHYEYRTNLLFTNGLAKATDWQQTDKDDLTISIT